MLCDPIVNELLMDITNDEKSSVSIIECILTGVTSDLEIAEKTEIHLNTKKSFI
jgi:transcription initiation factor TFIIE subunit alpha